MTWFATCIHTYTFRLTLNSLGIKYGGGGGNTPYEGAILANQNGRKLGVFDRKLEGSPIHFEKHLGKLYNNVILIFSSFIVVNTYPNYNPLS